MYHPPPFGYKYATGSPQSMLRPTYVELLRYVNPQHKVHHHTRPPSVLHLLHVGYAIVQGEKMCTHFSMKKYAKI